MMRVNVLSVLLTLKKNGHTIFYRHSRPATTPTGRWRTEGVRLLNSKELVAFAPTPLRYILVILGVALSVDDAIL